MEAVTAVLDSGSLVHGVQHRLFEAEFGSYLGVSHAIGVASGTDALELCLRAASRDTRRKVVTVANAGGYTSIAARSAGFQPVYADVSPDTHCMDPRSLREVIDDDVFAVVVTHLYGRMADVASIREVLRGREIAFIEDCAQSAGARSGQVMAGGLGDIAAFSFYPTKNLGALGDGGAIVTNDDALAYRVRQLRQYGWDPKYYVHMLGGRNSRLDELQAAFLRLRLRSLNEMNERRREIIRAYAAAAPEGVEVLPADDETHAAHLAVVVSNSVERLAIHLAREGIMTAVHYPLPDHLQPAWLDRSAVLPVTEGLVGHVLSLPCFPELEGNEVEAVCSALARYSKG